LMERWSNFVTGKQGEVIPLNANQGLVRVVSPLVV